MTQVASKIVWPGIPRERKEPPLEIRPELEPLQAIRAQLERHEFILGEILSLLKPPTRLKPLLFTTVNPSANELVRSNERRKELLLQNVGTTDIFIGDENVATNKYAAVLKAATSNDAGDGGVLSDFNITGRIFGLVSTGTGRIAVLELE